jgi:aspartokinase/homoserine dehydrogenase 1
MRILKFGGTSVGTVQCLRTVLSVVRQNAREARTAVVVSALGGVTDGIIAALDRALKGNTDQGEFLIELRERHRRALDALSTPERAIEASAEVERWLRSLEGLLRGVALLRQCPPVSRDAILSMGERLSLPVLVATLRSSGVNATPLDAAALFKTDGAHGEAEIDLPASLPVTRAAFALLEGGEVGVLSGFIGTAPSGSVATLGRSGSDYSAAALGNLLDAECVEIWTDTDGVMSADPRVVREASSLRRITYREATDLAFFGARVLHPRTMGPLEAKGIPLIIRNTFRPDSPGTTVTSEQAEPAEEIKSVTSVPDASLISLRCRRDVAATGMYVRLFGALDRVKAPVFSVHQSVADGSVSFVTRAERAEEIVGELNREFSVELQLEAIRSIEARNHLSIVAAVGSGMRASPGLGRRFYETLERTDIRPIAVSQGGADLTISAIVEKSQERKAITALHSTFFRPSRRVALAIAGPTGMVGRALLSVLAQQESWLKKERSLELNVVGAINTRTMTWDERGIPAHDLIGQLQSDQKADWERFAALAREQRGSPLIFLDCTASAFIARQYLHLLQSGAAIVTPNKIANTLEFPYYEELRRLGRSNGLRYLYETTVGAATPMLQALEDLRRTGDRIQRVEGVLSGTLSYVFNRLNHGELFSEAVRGAAKRGFTEPHPAMDLSGRGRGPQAPDPLT